MQDAQDYNQEADTPDSVFINLTPAERKLIRSHCEQVSGALLQIDAQREYIKEARTVLFDELNKKVNKKAIARLSSVYHQQRFHTLKAETDEFETVYELVFNPDGKQQ